VFIRLYRALGAGRLDTSRSLARWLITTTRRVARVLRARTRHEELTATGTPDMVQETRDMEERMPEAVDVHTIVNRILDKLTPEQREVFVMSDLEDTPMDEVIEELGIAHSTAYYRLEAARKVFRREWEAMQKSNRADVAPFALLSMSELIAAEKQSIPDVPQSETDALLRRLGEALGQDFLGPATTAAESAGAATGAGAAVLTTWKIGIAVALIGLGIAGDAGLASAQHATNATPPPPTAAALLPAPSITAAPVLSAPSSVEPPASAHPSPPPSGAPAPTPAAPTPSDTPSDISQGGLIDTARVLLDKRQPGNALALLERVTAPALVDEREALRRRALAAQAQAAR
jgi:RNA polymerase sigma factor (sigma-70 family)